MCGALSTGHHRTHRKSGGSPGPEAMTLISQSRLALSIKFSTAATAIHLSRARTLSIYSARPVIVSSPGFFAVFPWIYRERKRAGIEWALFLFFFFNWFLFGSNFRFAEELHESSPELRVYQLPLVLAFYRTVVK